jgi:uncharacterized damage-inducible protein DinB
MDSKEMLLQNRDREFKTTLKVLKALPDDKLETRPAAMSKNARELAWVFVVEERLTQKLMQGGQPDFGTPPLATMSEIIKELEAEHARTNEILKKMSPEDFKKTASFFVAPKTPGEVPKETLAWMMFFDSIHHRGQFSIYLRLAGAKVPSIYGPSADEPWT